METRKFRGLRVNGDGWIYGYHYFNEKLNKHFISHWFKPSNNKESWTILSDEVKSETIGQFTGFIDPNGFEVYEGDTMFNSNGLGKGEVKWCAPSFMIIYPHVDNYALTLDEDFDTCEVNGNVFESEGKIKEKVTTNTDWL